MWKEDMKNLEEQQGLSFLLVVSYKYSCYGYWRSHKMKPYPRGFCKLRIWSWEPKESNWPGSPHLFQWDYEGEQGQHGWLSGGSRDPLFEEELPSNQLCSDFYSGKQDACTSQNHFGWKKPLRWSGQTFKHLHVCLHLKICTDSVQLLFFSKWKPTEQLSLGYHCIRAIAKAQYFYFLNR